MKKGKGRRGKGPSREVGKRPAPRKPPKPAPKSYEFLDHPADVGFLARGRTLAELFAAAAQAMCDFGWELDRVEPQETVEIRARAGTVEDLLYSWLSEVLFLSDAEGWVFKRFAVAQVSPPAAAAPGRPRQQPPQLWEVRGQGQGERFRRGHHKARTYVKAVTYHQLSVQQRPEGWQATAYLDV